MSEPDELGGEFVQKKMLEAIGIEVPEDALGFFVKENSLFIEAMDTEDLPGTLMINVNTIEVPLSGSQVDYLKKNGLYSSKGFRLG